MTAGICEVDIENGKVFSGDSSFEIVGGSDEVIGGGGRMVECSALGTNCIVLGSAIAKDGEVEGINEEVNSKKTPTVNQLVPLKSRVVSEESVNIHLDVSHGEIGQTCEVEKLNGLEDLGDVVDTVEDSGDVVDTVEDSGDVVDTVEDSGDVVHTVEDSGDVVQTVEDSSDVVQTVEDLGDVVETVEDSGFAHDQMENGDTEVPVVDDEAHLSDIVGEDAKLEEQVKGNPEFIIKDTEFVESDVKSEDQNKENVEIIDDNNESQIVVMDGVENTCNQDDDVIKYVEDAPNPDDDITQSVNMAEHEQETEASNYPITYHTRISQLEIDFPDVSDEKQTEFEVKEAPIAPILIFPDTLVSPDIIIQFGSFGCHKKDQNQETETTYRANSNNLEIVLDDLQGNISVDKDMDDMVPVFFVKASSKFIDSQIEDTDSKIHKMEDMLHYEPLCLKDENQFICEIKQSKSYVSNMGIHDEIQHALNKKREIEEHLKNSKNEMNSLEDNVSKPEPEVAALEIRKTHEENDKEKEMHIPFQAADETKSTSVVSTVEQGKKKMKHTHTDYQTVGKAAGKFNHMIKTKEPVKLIVRDSMFACLNELPEDEDEEKEKTVVGFDKKSDKLRKEESERKLKEQIRLEKAREKRLRKKERKKNKEIEPQETKPKPHLSEQLKLKIIFTLAFTLILIFLATI